MRLDEAGLTSWGRAVGAATETPVFFCLSGELGAGKSVLARAVGAGAGVTQSMPSPSYNLLFRYAAGGGRSVVHLDLYRIADPDELWELGWEDLGGPGDLVLVEWPERAGPYLPADHWWIELHMVPGRPFLRDVSVRRVGSPPELPAVPLGVPAP